MSLKEVSDTIKAKSECDIQRIEERARFDYTLAKLISYAVHAPKDFPDIETAYPVTEKRRDTSQDWRLIKAQMSAAAKFNNERQGD